MKTYTAILVSMFACGCASTQLNMERQMLTNNGQPPSYVDGYVHGCSTGTRAAGNPYFKFTKDVKRVVNDEVYKEGWSDGFEICKTKYQSLSNR